MTNDRFPRQISVPVSEPLTLELMRSHLALDLIGGATTHPDDSLLTLYGKTAREAAEGFTGCVFAHREFALALPGFPLPGESIRLETFPVTEITAISYRDTDGALQSLPTTGYELDLHSWPSVVDPLDIWPDTDASRKNAVTIQFFAGPEAEEPRHEIPTQAISAMLLHVSELYENRGEASARGLSDSSQALLWPLRINRGM